MRMSRVRVKWAMAAVSLVMVWCCVLVPARADVTDLSDGVFIMHHPPDLSYSIQSAEDWCASYVQEYAIEQCAEQHPRIDTFDQTAWFVLSAWEDEKEWCGTIFGLANYDPDIFDFVDWGPCGPGEVLELTSGAWPGPNSSTAFVTTGGDYWAGNFVPVYCFVGYAYSEGMIPMGYDSHPPHAGWGNCLPPAPEEFEAVCLPSMGILMDGVTCCPDGPTEIESHSWGGIRAMFR